MDEVTPFYTEAADRARFEKRAALMALVADVPPILPHIVTRDMVAEMNANAEFFGVRPSPVRMRDRVAEFFRRVWPWRKTKFNPALHWTPEEIRRASSYDGIRIHAGNMPDAPSGCIDLRAEACAHTDFARRLGQPDREDVI